MSVRRVPRAAPKPSYCSNIECSRRMVGNIMAKHVGRCGACRTDDLVDERHEYRWDGTLASIDDYEGGLK